jgi:hypothetical protein
VRRGFAGLSIVLGLAALLWSCASLGTRVEVRNPELVNSIQVVGLAPIYVDELTLSVCGQADSLALAALVSQMEKSGAFRVVSAESLVADVQGEGAMDAEALLASARRLNLDGVLFCKLEAWEARMTTTETVGFGVSFGTSGTRAGLVQEDVTKVNWGGAKVSLQVVESRTGMLVLSTQFDTVKGKSYWMPPAPDKQIADAMEGAFKPLAKAWAK